MNRIRVAHVIYSRAVGGSEMCAVEICTHLDSRIFDPMVLFVDNRPGPLEEILNSRGIPSCCLGRSTLLRPFWKLIAAWKLQRLSIDVLHVHHLSFLRAVLPAARMARIPAVVYTEHSWVDLARHPVLVAAAKKLPSLVEAVTAVSEDICLYLCGRGGIRSDAINVLPNGVDTRRFIPVGRNPELMSLIPDTEGKIILISVGRLNEAKDYPTYFKALAILKKEGLPFHALIIGEGKLREELNRNCLELDLADSVTFAGGRTDIDILLPGADIFVLSSRHEGLPIAVLEAMSCGVAIVATAVGGIPSLIHDSTEGLVVPPEHPEALARAIRTLHADKLLRQRLGTAARKRAVSSFSWQALVIRYQNIYLDLTQPGLKNRP